MMIIIIIIVITSTSIGIAFVDESIQFLEVFVDTVVAGHGELGEGDAEGVAAAAGVDGVLEMRRALDREAFARESLPLVQALLGAVARAAVVGAVRALGGEVHFVALFAEERGELGAADVADGVLLELGVGLSETLRVDGDGARAAVPLTD